MDLDDLAGGAWDKYWVWKPAGTHFGADGSSPLAFSDVGNKLAGQARLGPLVDRAEDTLGEGAAKVLAGVLVGIGGTVLATKYVVPQVKKLRARFKGTSEVETDGAAVVVVLDAVRVSDFSESVGTALADLGPEMTGKEAQRRILNIMLAAVSIAENLRALDGAHIQADDTSHALEAAIDQLSASKVTDSINQMLQSDSTLLSEEDSVAFLKAFGGGRVHGEYVPIKRKQVKKALRLPE